MKLHRERWFVIIVLAVLLLGGLFWGRRQGPSPPGEAPSGVSPDGFRDWFWRQRSLDLMVQVALIFAGAAGVAAILPDHREEESELCTWL